MSRLAEVDFVKPDATIIRYVADNMRDADVAEIQALSGRDPLTCLIESVNDSDYCTCAVAHGRPVCIFGLVIEDRLTGHGIPWMLGTDDLFRLGRPLMVASRAVIDDMLCITDKLYNTVHDENKVSIRWLKRVGFTVGDAYQLPNGETFRPFHLEKIKCVNP